MFNTKLLLFNIKIYSLGPLSVEKRAKKVIRQVRLTKNKEDLVQPDKVIDFLKEKIQKRNNKE